MLGNPVTAVIAGVVLLGTFAILPDAGPGGGSSIKGSLVRPTKVPPPADQVGQLHIDLSVKPPGVYDLDAQSASDFAAVFADHPKQFIVVEVRSSRGESGTYAPTIAWDTVSVRVRMGLFDEPTAVDRDIALALMADWWKQNRQLETDPGRAELVAARIISGGSGEVLTLAVGYFHNTIAIASACLLALCLAVQARRGYVVVRNRVRAKVEASRRSHGNCPMCNYPMPPLGRCPECGTDSGT